jgi:type VI secretion system lysozyme-like protein
MALVDKMAPARRRGPQPGLERVLRNLTNVLNSRRGYSSFLPDFGMRTLTEFGSRAAIATALMQDVRECIERYEPRLRLDDLQLDKEHNPLRVSLTLKCTLLDSPQELQISFDTLLHQYNVDRR